eukprot:TRINITY_DN4911_c0_g1_i1.p1 TRINITY_DN4911_c0_g1~~TRINITY_DN4911_c0_g1_i1.p1  ORF type:complete len:312 (-),score=61.94 TRINITY_DN4911_c0_g1_i1:352-1227(-)
MFKKSGAFRTGCEHLTDPNAKPSGCAIDRPGSVLTDSVLSSWAYNYYRAAERARAEAVRKAADAERFLGEASAARAQAEAAMTQEKLAGATAYTAPDGSLRPFYRFCDRVRTFYYSLQGDREWMKTDVPMLQLRKFCAGLEHKVNQEVRQGSDSAYDLGKSGLTMYDIPRSEFCAEPQCPPAWAPEVPSFRVPRKFPPFPPPPPPGEAGAMLGGMPGAPPGAGAIAGAKGAAALPGAPPGAGALGAAALGGGGAARSAAMLGGGGGAAAAAARRAPGSFLGTARRAGSLAL